MSDIILTDAQGTPKQAARPRYAQLGEGEKIYFWHNPRTDHIFQGAPPRFDNLRPAGYQTIECLNAHDAERWSKRLADQSRREAEMNDEEREAHEGPIRADLRREAVELLRKTTNPLAARMLRYSIAQLDKNDKTKLTKHESFLHVEGYEHGR